MDNPFEDEKDSAVGFLGDAEAVLAVSENADQGIMDLVDAYKSGNWDNPAAALETVEIYANKLREKSPATDNLLTPEEAIGLSPVKPQVGAYIQQWNSEALAAIRDSSDPYVRAYKDNLTRTIDDVATSELQRANNENISVTEDKLNRFVMGAFPGAIKELGAEQYLERRLRADSNDTFASAVTSGFGSIVSLPFAAVNMPLNMWAFGSETYKESRETGASIPQAALAGGLEGVNQALDVILDKFLVGKLPLPKVGRSKLGIPATALGEGTQEYGQNKLTEFSEVIGLTKEEMGPVVSEQDIMAFGAGAVVGGAVKTGVQIHDALKLQDIPTQTTPVNPFEDIGIEADVGDNYLGDIFPENQPVPVTAVIGEPVHGGTNVTTIGDASTGTTAGAPTPSMQSDAGETFIENPDGSISRVVGTEMKQAHTDAIKVSPEDAQKIALLQSTEMGPEQSPVVIQTDDLGRPFIQHPKVTQDLVVDPEHNNPDPVLIKESPDGHLLQMSSRLNEAGIVEKAASISKGKVSTAGAMEVKESTVADKLRDLEVLNPNIKELLQLNTDFSLLNYIPNTNEQSFARVNELMARHDNNYILFANSILLNKELSDVSPLEALTAGFAAASFSERANTERTAGNIETAEQYDDLAAKLIIAYQTVGTTQAQELQMRVIAPFNGPMVLGATRSQGKELATARAAQDLNLPIQEVNNVIEDNRNIKKLETGLTERIDSLNQQEAQAEERANALTLKVEALQKQINDLKLEKEAQKKVKKEVKDSTKILTDAEKTAIQNEIELNNKKIESLTEQLKAEKAEDDRTKVERKAQLKAEKERIKKEKDAAKENQDRLNERKVRNDKITENVEKYKREFESKLTPETSRKITELAEFVQTQTGRARELALKELGETIANVKGIKLVPGSNPWTTFWSSNVLSSIGTSTVNIFGNFAAPISTTVSDISRGNLKSAGRFVRGWTGALFEKETWQNVYSGAVGELSARKIDGDETTPSDLKDIASGVHISKESDPYKSLLLKFGTGKLGKFMSSPAISLRLLGSMDAFFSRMATEGLLARDAPSYKQYLNYKADNYDRFLTQAKNEEARLRQWGVETPKYFINQRADELSFMSRPKKQQETVRTKARRMVFQDPEGARGIAGKTLGGGLNIISKIPVPFSNKTDINVSFSNKLASAIGFANRVQRENTTLDQILPVVSQGLVEGKTLIINGTAVEGVGTTRNLLGTLVDAVNNKQIITLKGESIKPLKYVSGMFVNTAAQLMDMSMEGLPVLGYLDKRFSNAWDEYSDADKQELYGNQIAATAFTSAILAALWDNFDDEPNSDFYIYGGHRDEKLREYYKIQGKKPFSMRARIPGIGNVDFVYKDIPGLNLIFGIMGEFGDAAMVAKRTNDRPFTTKNALEALGYGTMYTASKMTLLKNLGTFADLVSVGDVQGKFTGFDVIANVASGFVPFSGAGKELERFVYGDLSRPKSGINRQIQNLPFTKFFSENKPSLNVFGEPVKLHNIPGVSRLFGEVKESPEIAWLLSNGYTFGLPKTGTKLSKSQLNKYSEMLLSDDPDNFESYLTEDDQYDYIKMVGPQLKDKLTYYSNAYPNGYDENVQKRLDRDINRIKARVKNQILRQPVE